MKKIILYLIIAFLFSGCAAKRNFENARQVNTIEAYEEFVARFPEKKYTEQAKNELAGLYQEKDWGNARTINTIDGFENFQKKYPISSHAEEANTRISFLKEEQAWISAQNINTIKSYEEFLSNYPNSEFSKTAANNLYALKLELDWKEANETGTIQSYQTFLQNYPSGKYERDARDKILYLEKYENGWQLVKQENAIESFKAFINKYPNTTYSDSSAQAIQKIEDDIWEGVLVLNTVEAYQNYIIAYPDSKFVKLAEMKIIDFEVDQVFKGKYGKMPAMQRSGSYSEDLNSNQVEVYNNTSYILTVLYSGPESKKIELPSRQRIEFNLPNGKYRIAASVDASNVQKFAGTENLTGGEYDVEYYIYTTSY